MWHGLRTGSTRAAEPGTAVSPGGPDNGVGVIKPGIDGTTEGTSAGQDGTGQPTAPGSRAPSSQVPSSQVPSWLQRAAGWSWRLLLVGIAVYLAFRVASMLKLVVLPCVAALLLTALLQPVLSRLRRAGLPALAATWCTLLFAVAVLGGAVTLAATRATADYPTLVRELTHTGNELDRKSVV